MKALRATRRAEAMHPDQPDTSKTNPRNEWTGGGSAASFQALFGGLTDMVVVLSLDGQILNANPAVVQRLGYAREEIIGATPALVSVDPDDFGITVDLVERAAAGEPQRFEFTTRTRADEVFPSEVVLTPCQYEGMPRLIAVARDISDRKAMEKALRDSESHYRRLVETSTFAIYSLDPEGRFIEVNEAATEILGRTADELLQMSMVDVLAPEDLTRAWEERNAKFSGRKRITDYDVTVIRPSGERRLIRIRSTLIGTVETPLGTHGIARDITEERERESEIRMLATALEKLESAVSISAPDGTLVYANAAHVRILGDSPFEVDACEREGRPGHGEERPTGEEIFRTVVMEGSWTGRILRRRRDNGRIVPFECVLGRLDLDRTEPLIFGFARDVSGAVATERRLRRIERLASVGTMIGGIAHELNNPLHAVRNFAELMLMEPRNELDTEALEIIRREADRAAQVIADLRVFARQDEGEAKPRVEVDVNDLIRKVVGLRRYGMETRSIEIVEELSESLPPIALNPAEMEQVILELIHNAEHAMVSRAGEKRLTLATRANPSAIEIEVRDTGAGIPEGVGERIFDPFFTTRDPGAGAGLGLPRVHTIVREHGGEIQVRGAEPRGTAFILEFPRDVGRSARPAEATTASTERRQILFVDDEDSLRRAAARYFAYRGDDVRVASDGAEALRLLDGQEFDAIVSDLRMPGMDGETLLRRLEDEGKGRAGRVIFVTGDATSSGARVLAARGIPVLYKPVHLDQIDAAIDRLLSERVGPANG